MMRRFAGAVHDGTPAISRFQHRINPMSESTGHAFAWSFQLVSAVAVRNLLRRGDVSRPTSNGLPRALVSQSIPTRSPVELLPLGLESASLCAGPNYSDQLPN
jgi:hypothetical protein